MPRVRHQRLPRPRRRPVVLQAGERQADLLHRHLPGRLRHDRLDGVRRSVVQGEQGALQAAAAGGAVRRLWNAELEPSAVPTQGLRQQSSEGVCRVAQIHPRSPGEGQRSAHSEAVTELLARGGIPSVRRRSPHLCQRTWTRNGRIPRALHAAALQRPRLGRPEQHWDSAGAQRALQGRLPRACPLPREGLPPRREPPLRPRADRRRPPPHRRRQGARRQVPVALQRGEAELGRHPVPRRRGVGVRAAAEPALQLLPLDRRAPQAVARPVLRLQRGPHILLFHQRVLQLDQQPLHHQGVVVDARVLQQASGDQGAAGGLRLGDVDELGRGRVEPQGLDHRAGRRHVQARRPQQPGCLVDERAC
mmetsp:Transcript_9918/g.40172  ORF Transcript_9918/g.40172 Transcript_9918/m.40172 type:complete len:363 (+) Transcript_9918:318-1406(+)